jgi:RNA polymerase sigma-70 factor, ECF subfamily
MSPVSRAEELQRPPWPTDETGMTQPEDLNQALQAARNGDENAFRILYRRIQPRLLRYVRTLVGEDAKDVTSEAWLQIAKDLASFRGDIDDFRSWTATIARNRALDHLRYRRRRPVEKSPADRLSEQLAPDDTDTAVMDIMGTRAALALIGRLPSDQAEIIVLRVVVGLDTAAVAKLVGKRAGAVRTAAHRGLRRLERLLNDLEHPQ